MAGAQSRSHSLYKSYSICIVPGIVAEGHRGIDGRANDRRADCFCGRYVEQRSRNLRTIAGSAILEKSRNDFFRRETKKWPRQRSAGARKRETRETPASSKLSSLIYAAIRGRNFGSKSTIRFFRLLVRRRFSRLDG